MKRLSRFAFTLAIATSACADAPPPKAEPPKPAAAPCKETDPRAIALSNEADTIIKMDGDRAIALYEEAASLARDEHRIAFKLALAYRTKEDWNGMVVALEHALEHAPTYGNYWFERGYALEQLAKKKSLPWPDVRVAFERCVEADPNIADCHQELGAVLLRLDDETGAIKSYTRAIRTDPTQARRYAPLADLYLRLDFVPEALTVLDQAKAFSKPGDRALYSIFMLSAEARQARGEMVLAVKELEQAKAHADPDAPEGVLILYSLGSAYALLTPPRAAESVTLLKGFINRVCKGAKARVFKAECESSQTLVSGLGGSMQ